MTVNETNPIYLSCDASGFPAPSITWTRSGKVFSDMKQLNITKSGKSDAGEYMCTASNGVGQPKTAKAYVTVQCESKFHNILKLSAAAARYPLNHTFLNYLVSVLCFFNLVLKKKKKKPSTLCKTGKHTCISHVLWSRIHVESNKTTNLQKTLILEKNVFFNYHIIGKTSVKFRFCQEILACS